MGLFVTHVRFLLLLVIQHNNAIAEEENINNCVPSCLGDWEEEGDRCYLWPLFRSNWREADEYCMKEGGHLASVTNMKIHNYIQSKVTIGQIHTYFWIGGTDQAQEGDWRWTDGSPWNFTMWGPGQPDNWLPWGHDEDEDCLQINFEWHSKSGWNDIKCNTQIEFVCSQPLCADNDTNISTSNNTNGHNNTGHPPGHPDDNTTIANSSKNSTSDFPVTAVATSSGISLIIAIFIVAGCLLHRRPKKKEEEITADENPVYGVYQLGEAYERQYSTNEAVDNNLYYE